MATEKRTFYRPHPRIQFDGTLVDQKTGEIYTPPSMTKQEFKKECDINNIIKQYSATGQINHISAKAQMGMYADLPDSMDFQESLHLVEQARASFMSLPAMVRDRFGQDPQQFLAFCADPANADELRRLGLANPLPVVTPEEVKTASTGELKLED